MYKQKVLLIHRNSLLQERIANYLRENDFTVIVANNIDNMYDLSLSMNPDIILWGAALTAKAKKILQKMTTASNTGQLPVIAMMPDMELFDRVEIEKHGITDIVDTLPKLPELKLKIRMHLANYRRLQRYEREAHRLQEISELQFNFLRIKDSARMGEILSEYIRMLYEPVFSIVLIANPDSREYEYKKLATPEGVSNQTENDLFELPLWREYYLNNGNIEAERITDSYVLKFLNTAGLEAQACFQFPMVVDNRTFGVLIAGFSKPRLLGQNQFDELALVVSSLAMRLNNLHLEESKHQRRSEDTEEIQYLFQRLDEQEIANYLSQQLLKQLAGDVSIYFNYNEGFKFLYPQYCYQRGNEENLFSNEKPPVLMVKDYPNFEAFIESNKLSSQYDLIKNPADDLKKLASLQGNEYNAMVLFSVKVGNERKGFFMVAMKDQSNHFSNGAISEAEQMVQKATNMLLESRLIRHAQKTIKQLDRVFELGKELTLESEIDDLLKKIASSIRRTLGWNIVLLERKNLYEERYENICVLGLQKDQYEALQEKYPESIYHALRPRSFKLSQSYFFDHKLADESTDLSQKRRRFLISIGKKWNENDWIIVPIQSRGRELGYIAVNDPVEQVRPSEDKVRSLEYFANQAAVALENAALYEDLKASEQKYRRLAETMIMGLVTCDYSGNIIYANHSLAQMLNYSSSEILVGQNLMELCLAKYRSELEEQILELKNIDANQTHKLEPEAGGSGKEIELMTNDNQAIPFQIHFTPLFEQLQNVGFLGVLADLRPQKRIERLKADFNSMIVHDLRSPLNIIQGYIDIVRNQVVGKITEEQNELLFIAKENVDKVLKLIDNFMTASKLEANKFTLELETHSINTIIDAVYQQQSMLAEKKNVTLKMELDDNISFQQMDRLRIEQVLTNYLSNAIKFTGQGGQVKVKSELVKEFNELTGQENWYSQVSVSDTGVGIPEEEQTKVFSKYEQTEAGKDASLKGTGLGLAICKEIISLHKGKVWVKSTPGKGSTFYFSLPIKPLKI